MQRELLRSRIVPVKGKEVKGDRHKSCCLRFPKHKWSTEHFYSWLGWDVCKFAQGVHVGSRSASPIGSICKKELDRVVGQKQVYPWLSFLLEIDTQVQSEIWLGKYSLLVISLQKTLLLWWIGIYTTIAKIRASAHDIYTRWKEGRQGLLWQNYVRKIKIRFGLNQESFYRFWMSLLDIEYYKWKSWSPSS